MFTVDDLDDQCVLSENIFVRLGAVSNHEEFGITQLVPGEIANVTFKRSFEYVCRAFLTPTAPVLAQAAFLQNSGMGIVCGRFPQYKDTESVQISWLVHGLCDVDSIAPWRIQFFAAVSHLANGFFKPALLDYASAFELFVDEYLRQKLTAIYGIDCANHLLRKSWRIEDRCKDLLELVSGYKLTERQDVYEPWDRDVRRLRNDLVHGKSVPIGQSHAEAAHQAIYQAIRWIESLSNPTFQRTATRPLN